LFIPYLSCAHNITLHLPYNNHTEVAGQLPHCSLQYTENHTQLALLARTNLRQFPNFQIDNCMK